MIITLLVTIAAMFLIQTLLGMGQVKNFNKYYSEMRKEGKVSIGRSKGLIRTGVVLLISIDQKARIKKVKRMQGLTVFTRFKDLNGLEGQHLLKIDEQSLNQFDRFTVKAIIDAQHVYRIVQAGGEPPKPKSPLQSVLQVFKRKEEVNS
ncbi:transcriptional regulator GutM [Halobacillus naozhouensis]|uniref:Transcriptional regulator GutM n=1 Tax=Halobacillus naozhouensis TaxID=554880 RepID=A0ABY8J4F4_9BACI|nr:transcriptional regulator GutM [Halobacillus naozhouensis]WFT75635.1 transcriptional regulator GutM [Halobacillus naozhouensis]